MPTANFVYDIPVRLMPQANKKAELISLLNQSLKNEATKIDGKSHASVLDLKIEKQIKKLANEIARGDP